MTVKIFEPTVDQATEEQKKQARKGKKVFLGNGRREGWSGELPFYLFRCVGCGELSVDYQHGWRPYVTCQRSDCKETNYF